MTNGNNKFDLEIKESLLIKRDKPVLNKNISSAKLFLFDNSFLIVSLHNNIVWYNIWLFSHGFMNIVVLVKIWNFNLKAVPR